MSWYKIVIASFIVGLFALIPRYFVSAYSVTIDSNIIADYERGYNALMPTISSRIDSDYAYFVIGYQNGSNRLVLYVGCPTSISVNLGSNIRLNCCIAQWSVTGNYLVNQLYPSSGYASSNITSLTYNNIYLLASKNATIYNGSTPLEPPVTYTPVDDFFINVNNDTATVDFGVKPTENSAYNPAYLSYQSSIYLVILNAQIGGSVRTLTIPTYEIYYPQIKEIQQGDYFNLQEIFTKEIYALKGYSNHLRSVALPNPLFRKLTGDPLEVADTLSFYDKGVYFGSNSFTARQLLGLLQDTYTAETFSLNDVLTEWAIGFIDTSFDNVIAYTGEFDWSGLAENEIPPDDPYKTNLLQNIQNVYNQLGNLSYQFNQLTGPSTATPFIYDTTSIPTINTTPEISDFEWHNIPDDEEAVSFFGWLVSSIYTSYFGIIAMCALSFLILRTIMR